MTNESQRANESDSKANGSDGDQKFRPINGDEPDVIDMPTIVEVGTPNLDPIDEPWSVVEIIRPEDAAE